MTLQPDLITAALKMVAALALILSVLWGALYAVKRFARLPGSEHRGRAVKVLASSYVGMKKTVSLVEIPGKILVLGITPERITLLDRIPKTDMPESAGGGRVKKQTGTFTDELDWQSGQTRGGQ